MILNFLRLPDIVQELLMFRTPVGLFDLKVGRFEARAQSYVIHVILAADHGLDKLMF